MAAPRPKDVVAERALRHALDEFARALSERAAVDARLAKQEELIELIIGTLPPDRRAELRDRFAEIKSGTPHKGGKAFGQVVQLFKSSAKAEWTVPEIVKAIGEQNNSPAEPKQITNALNYLTNIGRVQRIARGHYIVGGAGLVTDEEIPGADHGTRTTEHDW
jgi:hypothetical protein